MIGDEMVGWYYWLNGHEFEQAPGDGDGQGSVACYSPWGHKKLDMIERLKNTVILTSKERNRKSKMLSIVSHIPHITYLPLKVILFLIWIKTKFIS